MHEWEDEEGDDEEERNKKKWYVLHEKLQRTEKSNSCHSKTYN